MNDQEAREFVEMLAVPASPEPPLCPIGGFAHPLESRCSPANGVIVAIRTV
jgi:hypothetical protein